VPISRARDEGREKEGKKKKEKRGILLCALLG
jgi:hypothetical protein